MDVLLILNNEVAKNVRVMVKVTEKKLKEKVIFLLENDQDEEMFDTLMKNSEPNLCFPPDATIPRRSLLITLDEELIKNRCPKSLHKDCDSRDVSVCYT